MAERKTRKKRRAYLDDFTKNALGEYVYTGRHVTWKSDRKATLIRLWLLAVAGFAAVLGAGCIHGVGMEGRAWVLLPYAISLVAYGSVLYALGRLTAGGGQIRQYVFEASAKALPVRCILTEIMSGIALVGEFVNLLLPDFVLNMPYYAVFQALMALTFATTVLLRRTVVQIEWTE